MKLKKFRERNYKNIGITGFTIACILLIIGVFFYRSFALFEEKKNFNVIRGTIEDPGDLYFAYYVDDVITFEMPTKESGYTLSSKSNCTNGVTITWDKEKWGGFVDYTNYQKEVNSRTKCTLYFEKDENNTPSGGSGVDFITNLANTSEELVYDGTADNNLRYIGANPNNYVSFNNELWRIIGVMNNIDDGTGKKETRIKLIRNESIGKYSWDTSASGTNGVNGGYGVNEWSQADLMKLLNPGFGNESIGGSLYWNRGNGNCYNSVNNATTTCDFTSTGLTEEAKKLIGEAVWHTGSNGEEINHNNIITNKFYELERSNNTGKNVQMELIVMIQ